MANSRPLPVVREPIVAFSAEVQMSPPLIPQ